MKRGFEEQMTKMRGEVSKIQEEKVRRGCGGEHRVVCCRLPAGALDGSGAASEAGVSDAGARIPLDCDRVPVAAVA